MAKRVVTTEKYFTPPEVALKCVSIVAEHFDLCSFDRIVEPCVGDRAFFDLMPRDRRVGIDLDPIGDDVDQGNFLTWFPPTGDARVLTMGNPPFGQRAALAIQFLSKACEFSDVVAFILPRSFNKYTFQNRVNRHFHLVDAIDLDAEFHVESGVKMVRTTFQVWERKLELRSLIQAESTHPDFSMKHAHLSRVTPEELAELCSNFDFAIAQVGSNFIPKDPATLTRGSYWFVRENIPGVRFVFERLDFAFLDDMNTAHKSLGKPDIVAAYKSAKLAMGVEPVAVVDEKSIPVIPLSSDRGPEVMEPDQVDSVGSKSAEQVSPTPRSKNRIEPDGEQLRLL